MSPKELHCDSGRAQDFLEGRLPPDEEAEFNRHLDLCAQCRRRLTETAAEDSYWKEAESHLREDVFDSTTDAADRDSSSAQAFERGRDTHQPLRITGYLDPTDDPRMLGRFGGYEVVGVVGWGGMGVVLKGFETALDRYVAIKVLAPHLATSGAARSRFAREARAAAAVLHENVVAIHRVAEARGLPYLVMPYMAGVSLQQRLDEQGPLQLAEVLRIAMQVGAGLAAAHAQGLVHRDIKPANILLDRGVERVTITDFGLARAADDATLTGSGVIAGTPQYMSPEQARGEPVDHRSDLFSLGSVIYTMCTGRPPFRAETALGVLRRITETAPRPIRDTAPEIPAWLCEIVARLHAKDREERFQSAGEVADLLGRWLAHIQQPAVIPAPPPLRPTRSAARRAARRRRAGLWGGLTCLGALAVAAALLTWGPFAREDATAPEPGRTTLDQEVRAPVEPTRGATVQSLLDEGVLQQECQRIRERVSQIEAQFSGATSDDADGPWKATVSELRRQMDDLSHRIDQDLP